MRSYRVMVQSDVVVVVMVELDWKDGLVVASCYYIYIYKICIFVFWVRLVVVVVVVVVVWHSQLGGGSCEGGCGCFSLVGWCVVSSLSPCPRNECGVVVLLTTKTLINHTTSMRCGSLVEIVVGGACSCDFCEE